jgi:long-chain acyl-CoA synthetase
VKLHASTGPAPAPVVGRLPELLDWAAERYGDTPFLHRLDDGVWRGPTFRDAAAAMHAFRAALEAAGVRPGDRVGLQSENRPEYGIAWMAVLAAGAVVVPLDALLQKQECGEILATAGAGHCIVSRRQHPVIDAVRAERLPGLVLIGLDPIEGLAHWDEALRRHADAPRRPIPGEPGDLAVLIFTSGTTGNAKGVMLSHSNLLHNVEAVAVNFAFGPADRFLSVLPLHHTFESTGGFLCPLRVGASVCYARGLKSSELREDVRSSGATILLGVPLLYEKMLAGIHRGIDDAPPARRLLARTLLFVSRALRRTTGIRAGRRLLAPVRAAAGLARLRLFVSGAARLPDEVFWGFVDIGWPVLEGYGLTECSPVVAADRIEHPTPEGVGWPVPGVEVRIEDPDADGNGEIAVRGPNVMLGYYRQPEATAEVMRDGWFMTGDLGQLTGDGRLRITGRLKNMIATAAGKKIYPEEIETHIANCPYVLEVVVMGGADARGEREEVQAHVFPDWHGLEALAKTQGRPFDDAFVEQFLRREVEQRGQLLAPYKRVKRVIVRRTEFPKTTTGKIKRHGLAAEAGERGSSAVA